MYQYARNKEGDYTIIPTLQTTKQNMVVLLERHVNRHGPSANNLCRRRHWPFIDTDLKQIS